MKPKEVNSPDAVLLLVSGRAVREKKGGGAARRQSVSRPVTRTACTRSLLQTLYCFGMQSGRIVLTHLAVAVAG